MELERLAVQLRPRGPWEAMDLGVTMARSRWRSVWGAWLAVYAPAALALAVAFHDRAWIGALLLWWLKPLFDRFALHVLSHAVFGQAPRLADTLSAWRGLVRPGLLASLTVYRLNPARSFVLPVWQLERQSGAAGRARREALQRRLWSHAVWLTVVCVHFEAAVLLSAGSVIDLFMPAKADTSFTFADLFSGDAEVASWSWSDTLAYAVAVSLIEPLYVAAGFALYLDRRMRLEGWDVEVGLRRLAHRLGHAGALAAIGLALALTLGAVPGAAQATPRDPKVEIAEVLKAPEFQTRRQATFWRYRGEEQKNEAQVDRDFWTSVGRILAQITQILGWAALGVLVIATIWFAQRLLPAAARAQSPPEPIAVPIFRRLTKRDALPEQIAETAATLARQGRVREALSLLYRGALAELARRHGIAVAEGDTESDCVRRSSAVLGAELQAYFGALVLGWQRAAYSTMPPEREHALELCAAWARHFGAAAEPAGP